MKLDTLWISELTSHRLHLLLKNLVQSGQQEKRGAAVTWHKRELSYCILTVSSLLWVHYVNSESQGTGDSAQKKYWLTKQWSAAISSIMSQPARPLVKAYTIMPFSPLSRELNVYIQIKMRYFQRQKAVWQWVCMEGPRSILLRSCLDLGKSLASWYPKLCLASVFFMEASKTRMTEEAETGDTNLLCIDCVWNDT